jgi:sortase family protein
VSTDRRPGLGRLLLILVSLAIIAVGGVSAVRLADAKPSAKDPGATRSPTLAPPAAASGAIASSTAASGGAGVPVAIDIPVASSHHRHGVHARITAHGLNADRTLFVPADPTEVAWASDDAAPGSDRGTAILVSHVNYVVRGRTVAGAFADLAEYGRHAIGQIITVTLRDGRPLRYRIVSSREYSKDALAANPGLRRALYDQKRAFGRGEQRSGRLLLVSCGGAFDPDTGEYEDNVFVFALPVR